jgi:cell division protein FtsI/penicillin-binding protein 2
MKNLILFFIFLLVLIFTIFNFVNLMITIDELKEELEKENDCWYRNDCYFPEENILDEIEKVGKYDF